MKVLGIKDITRGDGPIYYRMSYSGVAVLELLDSQEERGIDFVIEVKPTGERVISLTRIDPVNYPLAPLTRELKRCIQALADNGGLPG